jgi:hypothetical protein
MFKMMMILKMMIVIMMKIHKMMNHLKQLNKLYYHIFKNNNNFKIKYNK